MLVDFSSMLRSLYTVIHTAGDVILHWSTMQENHGSSRWQKLKMTWSLSTSGSAFFTKSPANGVVSPISPFSSTSCTNGRSYLRPTFAGLFVKKADQEVLKDLDARGLLFDAPKFEHSFPHFGHLIVTSSIYGRWSSISSGQLSDMDFSSSMLPIECWHPHSHSQIFSGVPQ